MGLSTILGKDNTIEHLLPLFLAQLKDEVSLLFVWDRSGWGNLRHVSVTDETSVRQATLIPARWDFANASLLVESRKHWSERWMDECSTLSIVSSLYLVALFVVLCRLNCDMSLLQAVSEKSLNICLSRWLTEINRTKQALGLLLALICFKWKVHLKWKFCHYLLSRSFFFQVKIKSRYFGSISNCIS